MEKRGVKISRNSFYVRLCQWNSIDQGQTKNTLQLHIRIAYLFYQICLQNKELLQVLQVERFQITARGFVTFRHNLGLQRRISFHKIEETDQFLLAVVQKELDKGVITDYGRDHLYTYICTQQHYFSR